MPPLLGNDFGPTQRPTGSRLGRIEFVSEFVTEFVKYDEDATKWLENIVDLHVYLRRNFHYAAYTIKMEKELTQQKVRNSSKIFRPSCVCWTNVPDKLKEERTHTLSSQSGVGRMRRCAIFEFSLEILQTELLGFYLSDLFVFHIFMFLTYFLFIL